MHAIARGGVIGRRGAWRVSLLAGALVVVISTAAAAGTGDLVFEGCVGNRGLTECVRAGHPTLGGGDVVVRPDGRALYVGLHFLVERTRRN